MIYDKKMWTAFGLIVALLAIWLVLFLIQQAHAQAPCQPTVIVAGHNCPVGDGTLGSCPLPTTP
jgi:hypothetical protein